MRSCSKGEEIKILKKEEPEKPGKEDVISRKMLLEIDNTELCVLEHNESLKNKNLAAFQIKTG